MKVRMLSRTSFLSFYLMPTWISWNALPSCQCVQPVISVNKINEKELLLQSVTLSLFNLCLYCWKLRFTAAYSFLHTDISQNIKVSFKSLVVYFRNDSHTNIISKFIISVLHNTFAQRNRKPDWRLPKLFYKKCTTEKFPKLYWHFNKAVKSVATHLLRALL
jgi:hypothetical protein